MELKTDRWEPGWVGLLEAVEIESVAKLNQKI